MSLILLSLDHKAVSIVLYNFFKSALIYVDLIFRLYLLSLLLPKLMLLSDTSSSPG